MENKLWMITHPDPLAKLPALAKRLGVEPCSGGANVVLAMKDGTKYDLFDIINAALDRLDRR